jgi:hypothetical protein
MGNDALCCQRRKVEELARPPGAEADETLEIFQVLDLELLSHIPFNVCFFACLLFSENMDNRNAFIEQSHFLSLICFSKD